MRNGAKGVHNLDFVFVLYIIAIIAVIVTGIFIRQKIVVGKIKASNYSLSVENFSFSNYEPASISFYEEPKPNVTYALTDAAKRFSNAKAIVIGDSTAEGLTAYQVLNSNNVIWTRGRTVSSMKEDLAKVTYTPSIIFLSYGANDLIAWQGNSQGFINAYKNAISSIKQRFPSARICINSLLPVSQEAQNNNPAFKYEEQFNQALQQYCSNAGITFIDNRALLNQSPNGKVYEGDGIHPRYFYYSLWATNMINVSGI